MAKQLYYIMADGLQGHMVEQYIKYGSFAVIGDNLVNGTYSYDFVNTNNATETFPSIATQFTSIKNIITENTDLADPNIDDTFTPNPLIWEQLSSELGTSVCYIGGLGEDNLTKHLTAGVLDYEYYSGDDSEKMDAVNGWESVSNSGLNLGDYDAYYIHLSDPDHAGHGEFPSGVYTPAGGGYRGHVLGNPDYRLALDSLNTNLGVILTDIAVHNGGDWTDTLFILCADHGGNIVGHGGSTMDERIGFFYMTGGNENSGVQASVKSVVESTLSGVSGLSYTLDYNTCPKIEDMAITVLSWFGATVPSYVGGVNRWGYY